MADLADWQNHWKKVSKKPKPVNINGKKFCPKCYDQGVHIELTGGRQFLCQEHYYKEYRREKERIRNQIKRDGYEIIKQDDEDIVVAVERENEYNVKLGTSDFSPHMQTDEDGNLDVDKEKLVVRKELNRIKNEKTIGDCASQEAYGNYKPETREQLERNLAYTPDFDGYVQFGVNAELDTDASALATEEWHLEEDDETAESESEDEYHQRLREKYSDWEY